METSQATIDAKKLRAKGQRLWKCYRWTIAMRTALFVAQNGCCATCGRPENPEHPLNMDHEHFLVDAVKRLHLSDKWIARATFKDGRYFEEVGPTRAVAVDRARNAALPHSVRGLLCPGRQRGCNRLLGRVDSIQLLENFLKYLKDPPAKKILEKSLDKTVEIR